MSGAQENENAGRQPALRGAEALFLILGRGPMTTEELRVALGFTTRGAAWKHMNTLVLSNRYAMTFFEGRWGLLDQFKGEEGTHADFVQQQCHMV